MKNLLNVALSAAGTPSEVKERIGGQVEAIAKAPEQAPIAAAVRAMIDKTIAGVSEDETISVSANVSIDIQDVPAIVTARQQAERDAHATEKRTIETQLAAAKKELEHARAVIEAAKQPATTTAE